MKLRSTLLAASALLAACSPGAPASDPAAPATSTPPGAAAATTPASPGAAPAADGTERFYGQETFTIVHQLTGMETGTVTEHVRQWGRQRAEISKVTTSVGTIKTSRDTRLVVEGGKNVTVDNTTGAITAMENPFYATFVAAMKGKDPTTFGAEFMSRMGGSKTGENATIAGHACEYWTLMGGKTCITPWGGTLHTSTSMGGITLDRKASEVRMGDGGPDAAFAYDASKVQAQPNPMDMIRSIPGRN